MTTINLAVNIDLDAELSEEELASLTSALIKDLSWESPKLLAKVLSDPALKTDTTGSFNITALDEAEIAKNGATAALEAMAIACDERAEEHDSTVLSALPTSDPDVLEDIHIAAGIAGGFRAAAVYARGAIELL